MKKILPLFFILFSLSNFAQEKKLSQQEIKVNAFYLLLGYPEFGYEYLLNNESGVGASILFAIDKTVDIKFALTPYYRFYFGNKRAAGFFVEAFGMLNTTKKHYYYFDYNAPIPNSISLNRTNTDFALGISMGGKFITANGFLAEFYLGAGRNLLNSSNDAAVPRIGITLGKRF